MDELINNGLRVSQDVWGLVADPSLVSWRKKQLREAERIIKLLRHGLPAGIKVMTWLQDKPAYVRLPDGGVPVPTYVYHRDGTGVYVFYGTIVTLSAANEFFGDGCTIVNSMFVLTNSEFGIGVTPSPFPLGGEMLRPVKLAEYPESEANMQRTLGYLARTEEGLGRTIILDTSLL